MDVLVRKRREIAGQDQTPWTVNGVSPKESRRERGRRWGFAMDVGLEEFLQRPKREEQGAGLGTEMGPQDQCGSTSCGWGLFLWPTDDIMHLVLLIFFN